MPDDLPGGGVDVELVEGELEVEVILLLPVVIARVGWGGGVGGRGSV